MQGTIVKALAGFYYVESDGHIYQTRARGNFRKKGQTPYVGDQVEFSAEENSEGYILSIAPRKNSLVRPPIVNIDQAVVIMSAKEPDFNANLLDRFLVLLEHKGIHPIVYISKLDLLEDMEDIHYYQGIYQAIGYDFVLSIEELLPLLTNQTTVFMGQTGVGKSTLLNLINGDLVPTAGVLDIGETVRIGYFSQQIKDMDESKRVINYLQEVADEVKTTVGTTSITELLEQFLFPRSTHGTQIAKLSGGEKKRLYLLKILIEKPNVLLLDEPTNDLDIATLTVLENFLNGFGGPVVTVSHDRYFLDKVANKILAFEEGGVREFFGNYTDYLDEKAFLQEQSALLEKEKEQASVKVEKVKEDKKRMSYFEKQEWATIEDEIADLEAKIEEIEAAMLENASDYGQLATLQRDLDAANETLLEKYERYEYLSELEG